MKIPRLILVSPFSSEGKTTISTGLMGAYVKLAKRFIEACIDYSSS